MYVCVYTARQAAAAARAQPYIYYIPIRIHADERMDGQTERQTVGVGSGVAGLGCIECGWRLFCFGKFAEVFDCFELRREFGNRCVYKYNKCEKIVVSRWLQIDADVMCKRIDRRGVIIARRVYNA